MRYALGPAGERVLPLPGARARCGQCGSEVLAKCGKLMVWHWAHRAAECDSWSEGETEWHLAWKDCAQLEACEVIVGDHRADVRTLDGLVIELQHSPIAPEEIREREQFYGTMVWLFDARDFELALYPSGADLSFAWRHPRRSLLAVSKPLYWDLGSGFLAQITTMREDPVLGGLSGNGVLLDSACWASQVFGRSAEKGVHRQASHRAGRVAQCFALARSLLRRQPSLGLDTATERAMRELRTER